MSRDEMSYQEITTDNALKVLYLTVSQTLTLAGDYQLPHSPEDAGNSSVEENRLSLCAPLRTQEQGATEGTQIRYSINAEELFESVEQRNNTVRSLAEANQRLEGDIQGAREENESLLKKLNAAQQECLRLESGYQNTDEFNKVLRNQIQALQSNNVDLYHNLKRSQESCRSFERQYNDIQKKLTDRERQNTSLTAERDSLKQTEKTLSRKIRRMEQAKGSLESDLDTERSKVRDLQELDRASKLCISELESDLERAKDAQQVYAEDVRKAQETAFQLIEQAQWMPDADRDVTRKLNNLHSSMTSWCKNHAYKTAMNLEDLPADDQARVNRILSQVSQQVGETNPIKLNDLGLGSKGPGTLLLATLAHAVYGTIFSNPFFLETSRSSPEERQPGDNQEASTVLYRIYMDICKSDKKGANIWRSQTLRLLDPQVGMTGPSQEGRKDARDRRAAAMGRFSADFIHGDARVFLDLGGAEPPSELRDQLTDIATRAAELSYRLWTQRSQLSSLGIKELPKEGGAVRFSSNSDYLEHHPLHNLELHDDESCLDEKPVALVTHPAVVAYGNAEGSDYSTGKVWKKAVVWMGAR
ncbi:MAG: hypothetical protein M1813_000387 [Trichoglossum hirsutum]|nr:MAG: hypothetical protein M1813_000387 [Trichoglossum hirsutum]